MAYHLIHRHRFPSGDSSAPYGPIVSQRAVVALDGSIAARDTMRGMLRGGYGAYCIHIKEWVAICDRIHTFRDKGGVVATFDDGTQFEVIPIPFDGPDPRRAACPLIFTSDWLRMTEQERCDAFNASQEDK